MIPRCYPFPFRARGMRRIPCARLLAPPCVLPPFFLRVHPLGLTTEETQRVLSAAMVHGAIAVDTMQGLMLPEQFYQLSFQDLEGVSMLFMEWNRFTPDCFLDMRRSRIVSHHVDAAVELLLLRDPWARVILYLHAAPQRAPQGAPCAL